MTAQELIEHLQRLPADQPVFVEGYENGWDSLLSVEIGYAIPQAPCEDWDGEFERRDAASPEVAGAIFLTGRRGHRRLPE